MRFLTASQGRHNNIPIILIKKLSIEKVSCLSKTPLIKKHKYGEYKHVLLTDEEYESLKDRIKDPDKWIKILDEGIELKGYKYKSHYLAILKWYNKDQKNNPPVKQITDEELDAIWR